MASKRKIPGDGKVVEVKIIRGKGGAPIRTIVERAHGKPAGMCVWLKSGCALPWEIDENHFMWISEFDFRLHSFIVQPFRMEFWFENGDMIAYFPNIERTIDGVLEIVEIKKTESEIVGDPYYKLKLKLARKACLEKGWTFRIVTADEHILPGHLLDNVQLVQHDRLTRVTSEDHLRLDEAFEQARGKLTYGETVAALSGRDDPWDREGEAKLHALIVRRVVCVDLTRRLTQTSSVVLYRHPIWKPSQAA
jgi:hypothetical protein